MRMFPGDASVNAECSLVLDYNRIYFPDSLESLFLEVTLGMREETSEPCRSLFGNSCGGEADETAFSFPAIPFCPNSLSVDD